MHFLFTTILPLFILVCLSWTVFWLDEETVSNRINISFIGILSVVAYYFVIQNNIPNISYLTLIDAFIIITFLVLAASVVVSLRVDKLNKAGQSMKGDKIDVYINSSNVIITNLNTDDNWRKNKLEEDNPKTKKTQKVVTEKKETITETVEKKEIDVKKENTKKNKEGN